MRRLLVFLGLLSLLLVLGLTVSAALVQLGFLRSLGHGNVGWMSVPILVLYLVLSLRWVMRNSGGDRAV